MKKTATLWVLAGGLCAFGVGCGNTQEKAAEKLLETSLSTNGADVDVSLGGQGEQVNISSKTEEGTVNMSVGAGAQIPADFPKDVPVYPNLNVMLAHSVVEQQTYAVQGSVKDPASKVTEFYKTEAEKQGWAQDQVVNMPNMENLVYKKDGRVLTVSAVTGGEETTVSITVTQE